MTTAKQVHSSLTARWKVLQQRWGESCELWNDPVRHSFEREFWQEFEQVVPATLRQIEHLGNLFSQARYQVP